MAFISVSFNRASASLYHFGTWRFNCAPEHEADVFEIYGSTGKLNFAVFGDPVIEIENEKGKNIYNFEKPQHVQQYMIAEVVRYFLDQSENPCSGFEGAEVMKMIDAVAGGSKYE